MPAFVPFGTRLTFGAPVLPVTRVRKNVWTHEALVSICVVVLAFVPSGTRLNAMTIKLSDVGNFVASSLAGLFNAVVMSATSLPHPWRDFLIR